MPRVTRTPTVEEQPRVLIVGAGATGAELARRLIDGWRVAILDLDPSPARARLAPHLAGGRLVFHEGDASSRLVLERAGATTADSVVVVTDSEEVSYEVCRLLRDELSVASVSVLLRSQDTAKRFRALGVEPVCGFEAVAAVLASTVAKGSRVASSVGLGLGEVMETEILPNSGVIGKPLSALRPRRWLVAAVYRSEELIVPHGDTTLAEGDRVLLVGDPTILPSVARFLRTGHSEFPLHYGTAIVIPVEEAGPEALAEAAYLVRNTRAEALEFVTCGEEGEAPEALAQWVEREKLPARFACVGRSAREHLVGAVERRDVGILLQRPEPIPLLRRLGMGWTPLMRRIASVRTPVLVSRGTVPYRKILLAVTDETLDAETAILAIDAARNFEAVLSVGIVLAPAFVTGVGVTERLRQVQEEVRELALAYGVRVTRLEFEGNPVTATLAAAAGYQLLVVGLPRSRKTSLSRPSIEQNLVHRAPCSVLVLPR